MPRFFFHIDNGRGFQGDAEGSFHDDLDAARRVAICAGADSIADELKCGYPEVQLTITIEDDEHHPMMTGPMVARLV